MPRLDAYIPEGALSDEAENQLLSKLTDILLRNEGADPADPAARSIAFVWLHRPAKMFVAVEPAEEPRYRFEPRVPQGQFDDERRQSMVAEITEGFSTPKTGLTSAIHSGFGCFPTRSPRGRGEPPAASSGSPTSPVSSSGTRRRAASTPRHDSPRAGTPRSQPRGQPAADCTGRRLGQLLLHVRPGLPARLRS
jgi:phenylpyruvate tautomerase PptA (4-oxalocrotonate tautomerase family)